MDIINLTGTDLHFGLTRRLIPHTGKIAWAKKRIVKISEDKDEFDLFIEEFDPVNLPDEKPNTLLIVSSDLRRCFPRRMDLASIEYSIAHGRNYCSHFVVNLP